MLSSGTGPSRRARAPFGRVIGFALTTVLAAGTILLSAQPARADTAPPEGVPVTAGATALPTAQIDGVVWTQQIAGNRVYVGGKFTKARPDGVPLGGAGEVSRPNLMAYDLTTGAIISDFAPEVNGQVKDLALSPDGKVLYAAGQFTAIGSQTRYRVAAFDAATGALLPFNPNVNSTVYGITASNDTLFLVGAFTTVGGKARDGAAAMSRTTAAATDFNPIVTGGDPQAVIVSPDASKVVLGGNFTAVNGSSNPGYGLAMVSSATGSSLPLPINSIVRNADSGNDAGAITDLEATADGFYGTGFTYGRTAANLEGMFRADWDGNMVFMEDCHGDSYGVFPGKDAVYVAGHPHYCGNVGGFLQPNVWTYQRGLAFSNDVRGKVTRENLGYFNFEGQPAPRLLDWFPDFDAGTFTGQSQGPWDVTGNDDYVLYGGEFPKVNGIAQQGLVRFAMPHVTKPKEKPLLDYGTYKPTILAQADGRASMMFPSVYDRDSRLLTYQLYRDSVRVWTGQAESNLWTRPRLSYVDSGLVAGTTYTYSIRVIDPDNNTSWSQPLSYTYAPGADLTMYASTVMQDNPMSYWQLEETSGTTATDIREGWNAKIGTGSITKNVAGAISGTTGKAFTFSPTTSSTTTTVIPTGNQLASNTFTAETWFKSTSTRGGAIINFGGGQSGNSSTSAIDRVVYMANDGRLFFGVNPGVVRTVNTTGAYNNGQWHHIVATLDPSGQKLYVDGQLQASNAASTVGRNYMGSWRVGGDRLTGWTSNPTSSYFAGSIDEVAVYPQALSAERVLAHYSVGTTGALPNQLPTAAFAPTVNDLGVAFDAAPSSDPDGSIVSYAWNFGDGHTATGAAATHNYADAGTFTVTLTVTDNRGGTATTAQQVTTQRPNQAPTAAIDHTITDLSVAFDGTRSTDPDGTIASYDWSFGDGSTGTGTTASHKYAKTGTFTVRLTVTDNRGATASSEVEVSVVKPNDAPTAAFSWSADERVASFDASASNDSDGTIAAYAWTFGDGGVGTGATPSHRYETDGRFDVTLTVTDDKGATTQLTKTIDVALRPNVAPKARASAEMDHLKASVSGADSADSDGSIASYTWDFGDGKTGVGATTTHTYARAGTYTITLVVTDNKGLESAPVTVNVEATAAPNQAPTADLSSTSSGNQAQLDGTGSSDPDGSIASYGWDFGDGSTGTGSTPSHTYAGSGAYQVTLTVTDDGGLTAKKVRWVEVGDSAVVRDSFNRGVTRWGDADLGGTWTYAGPSLFSTDGQRGLINLPTPGTTGTATIAGGGKLNTNVFSTVSLNSAPTGGGVMTTYLTRKSAGSDYRMTVQVHGDSTIRLNLTKRVNNTTTNLGDVKVSGLTYTAGDVLNVRFTSSGTSSTSLDGKVWKAGTPEPGTAQIRRTDATAPELQVAGDFAVTGYLTGSATSANRVLIDHLVVFSQ